MLNESFLILFLVIFVFSGCNSNINNEPNDISTTELTSEINNHGFGTNEFINGVAIKTKYSKDYVSEFMTALNGSVIGFSDELKEENCYNVTPDSVSKLLILRF